MAEEITDRDAASTLLPAIAWDDQQNCWIVRSHALVHECLAADGRLLSSNFSVLQRKSLPHQFHQRFAKVLSLSENLLTLQDGPYHAHVRAAVVPAFNRAVKSRTPSILDMIERHVTALDHSFDLVEDLSHPISKDAIALVMDLPNGQKEPLIEASVNLLQYMEFGGHDGPAAEALQGAISAELSLNQLQDFFEQQMLRFNPELHHGFMGQMLREGSSAQKGALSESELIYQAITMLMAGFVTMTSLLARAIAILAKEESNLKQIVEDPAQFRQTLETLIRKAGPTAYVMRRATRGFSLANSEIRTDDLLQLRLIEANNDRGVCSSSANVEKRKNHAGHLAFGEGLHACPGASMAKLLLMRTLEALARNDISIRAKPGSEPEISEFSNAIVQYSHWDAINSRYHS